MLDECIPHDFRHSFPEHEIHTASWAGLTGKKNGDLLRSAQAAGYHVFLTVDRGIPFQQRKFVIAIIVLLAPTNQLGDLLVFVDELLGVLKTIKPGEIVQVGEGHNYQV